MAQSYKTGSRSCLQRRSALCPHCRRIMVGLRSGPNRAMNFRVRIGMEAGEGTIEEASQPQQAPRSNILSKVVKKSLNWLQQGGTNDSTLFPIPDHWAKQTGKLSRRARQKLSSYYTIVAKVNALEGEMEQLSDEMLGAKTDDFRFRVQCGESLDSILPEAFAAVREAAKRVLDMRHYDCQVVGGIVLHEGQIAEMDTGEGKTLVATLPVYLNALKYPEVHIVTVNEYLAKRDSQWMGKVYNLLGLSVAAVEEKMDSEEKKEAYKANVVYVTAQQLCFDYLGDWSAISEESLVLRDLSFAIVDEVDSILLDESRIPMILSAKAEEDTDRVELAAKVCHDVLIKQNYGLINRLGGLLEEFKLGSWRKAKEDVAATELNRINEALTLLKKLMEENPKRWFLGEKESQGMLAYMSAILQDGMVLRDPEQYQVALDVVRSFEGHIEKEVVAKINFQKRRVTITERGATLFRGALEVNGELFAGDRDISLWEGSAGKQMSASWGHYLSNAIQAIEFFRKGAEYIVSDGRVILIDEATGRTRVNSRYENGIHQAVEAKEKLLQDLYGASEGEDPVQILADNYTVASVTYQVFFRYYEKLAGMSGTARVEQAEFFETYGLSVVRIPTHKAPRRLDHPSVIFAETGMKIEALVYELAKNGVRPVLIGTNSVQESEMVLSALRSNYSFGNGQYRLEWDGETRHAAGKLLMLNARPEVAQAESQIIAQAGLPGMVTIATKMAGRGTDIVLGGNPRGLVESAIYKLVFSSIPLTEANGLDAFPRVPLPQFVGVNDPVDCLPASLAGHVHASRRRSTSSEESLVTLADMKFVLSGVMDITERLRLLVMKAIREKMERRKLRISDLDFEKDIRPIISEVYGMNEALVEEESGFRQKMIETALYTWLWFEQQCETYGDRVRDSGGLLVIGMSLAESQRIEDQLRGRAGRQGDPGNSIMFCDLSDPMFKVWSFQGVNRMLRSNHDIFHGKLQGQEANLIIKTLRSIPENLSARARRELRQYDEVMEEFRQQVYYLRDIMLRGTSQQRTQLVYSWLQDVADGLVGEFCSVSEKPVDWKVLGMHINEDGLIKHETLEECQTIEEALEVIFNPPDNTLSLPLRNIRKRVTPKLAQKEFSSPYCGELEKRCFTKSIFEAMEDSPDDIERLGLGVEFTSKTLSSHDKVNLRMPFVRIIPFTKEIQSDLLEFLHTGDSPRRGAAHHFVGNNRRQIITIELRHALIVHKELLHKQNHDRREAFRGKNRKQLAFMSKYIGELLIMLFEERKSHFAQLLCQEEEQFLVDAQQTIQIRQKSIMLDLLDVYWANFLSSVKRLQSSTSIRAFSRSSPLEEFTIESNREFASMLEQYRKSVVLNLAAPQYNMQPDSSMNMRREILKFQKKDRTNEVASTWVNGSPEGLEPPTKPEDPSKVQHEKGSETINQETNQAG